MSINLDRLIQHANELEPLPASVMRLTVLLARPEWDIDSVAHAIESDPAIDSKLVRLGNSVAIGARAIATAREAVVRLGAPTVVALSMSIGVREPLIHARPQGAVRDDALWRHSMAAALAVQLMARYCKFTPPPEAFTAALLHDVGKLLLCSSLGQGVSALLCASRESGRTELEAEWDVLEVTHPELGILVAQQWRLPPNLIQAISLHHAPLKGMHRENLATTRAIQLADCAAKAAGAGIDARPPSPAELEPVLDAVGISEGDFKALSEAVAARLDPMLALF